MKKITYVGFLSIFLLCLTFQTSAQDLKDFEECSDQKFTKCIPYDNLYREGASIGTEVHRYVIPRDLNRKTLSTAYQKLMDKSNRLIDELEDKEEIRDKWAKDNPEESFNPKQYEVDAVQKEIKAMDRDFTKLFDKVEKSHELYKRVWSARISLREIFEEVEDKLNYSKSHPKNHIDKDLYEDDDDKVEREKYEKLEDELEGYINKILAHIKGQKSTHKAQEDGMKAGMDEMEKLLKLR